MTGRDANVGLNLRQIDSMRDLEQIQLYDWNHVIEFLQNFYALASTSGNYFSKELGERLFTKLPGPLGKEIHENWKKLTIINEFDNIGIRIQFVISQLKDKCTYIQIQKDLKQKNVGFCKQIFTPQQYGRHPEDKVNKKPFKKNYVKKTYIRKSNARKPYLDKGKHVRKYNPNKTYKSTITCFACNKPGHLSSKCPECNTP